MFEQIFQQILMQCMKQNVIATDTLFVDATHVKACANRKKYKNVLVAKKQARFHDKALKKEINSDRSLHDKKPLKNKDDNNNNDDFAGGVSSEESNDTKNKKMSTTDPESGWFHKGEHKEVFAYAIEAACDKGIVHGSM